MPHPLRTQFLRPRRKRHERVDLPLYEEGDGIGRGICYPADVPSGVKAHLRGHGTEEDMLSAPKRSHGSAPEVANRPHAIASDQLEATDMSPGQNYGWVTRLEPHDVRANKVHTEVDGTRRKELRQGDEVTSHPLHIGEPL